MYRGGCRVLTEFTPGELRTLVLAFAYERERWQDHPNGNGGALPGQHGFYLFRSLRPEDLWEDRHFKTLNTVRRWLESGGWRVTLEENGWQGYVAYVFEHFARVGQRPLPCQLKSPVSLRKYLTKPIEREAKPARTPEQLRALYGRILHLEEEFAAG